MDWGNIVNIFIEVLAALFLVFSSENGYDSASAQYEAPAPIEEVAAPVTLRTGMRRFAMLVSIEQDDFVNLRAGDVVNVFIPAFLAVPGYSQAERFQGTYLVKNLVTSMRVLGFEPQETAVERADFVEVVVTLEVEVDDIMMLVQSSQARYFPSISKERIIRFSALDRDAYGPETYTEIMEISLPQEGSRELPLILKPEIAGLPEFCESCSAISVDTFFERADIDSTVCIYLPLADDSRWSRFACPESHE